MTPDNHPYHISAHEQIEAIKANDHGFLQWLYREYYPQTEAYVLQNSGTTDEAKDVYQEAFIAMWRNVQMNRFEPKNDHSLAAYLLQIAKHKWLDHLLNAFCSRSASISFTVAPAFCRATLLLTTSRQSRAVIAIDRFMLVSFFRCQAAFITLAQTFY